jgi:NADPH:quinone reductase-like Zn-dependent oxidoreductase
MRAVVYEAYGPPEVLHLKDIDKPLPKEDEVLVKVQTTTVTIGDVIMRRGRHPDSMFQTAMLHLFMGLRRPKRHILGMELAGEIEAVGRNVTTFQPGDQVFASTFEAKFGAYAEYKCLPARGMLAKQPVELTQGAAAALPGGGLTALNLVRKAQLQPGSSVLVYGASGAVGTNAVQLAKAHGAVVTGVCSTANLDLVQSLGADDVLDYTSKAFAAHSGTYDVVLDAVAKLPPAQAKALLKPGGRYLNVLKHSGGKSTVDDLRLLGQMVEAGTLRPVIDRRYPLTEMVEAHRYVEQGHKRGNVLIDVMRQPP